MMKRFKVWSYKEGDQPLVHDGPVNDIYGIEGQFIDELEIVVGGPSARFRASQPEEAHAFFFPFSVANIVHYVYKPITSPADFNRARLHRIFNDYVDVVARKYPLFFLQAISLYHLRYHEGNIKYHSISLFKKIF